MLGENVKLNYTNNCTTIFKEVSLVFVILLVSFDVPGILIHAERAKSRNIISDLLRTQLFYAIYFLLFQCPSNGEQPKSAILILGFMLCKYVELPDRLFNKIESIFRSPLKVRLGVTHFSQTFKDVAKQKFKKIGRVVGLQVILIDCNLPNVRFLPSNKHISRDLLNKSSCYEAISRRALSQF